MMTTTSNIPISLYIHFPWCIRKCPYCDFNSHTLQHEVPEKTYINMLIDDLKQQCSFIQGRVVQSIFLGGGTPSLFSADSFAHLFEQLTAHLQLDRDIEITLEANPGTVDQCHFKGFYKAGINRLSLGIQSFQNEKLTALGRIHNADDAIRAVNSARQAGFNNINIDLMFGLPKQTPTDALFDLQSAIDLKPQHISWYQLTLEPNTYFYQFPPRLPDDDLIWDMQEQGQALLSENGFEHYEISAYSQPDLFCRHNLNYWEFGDYLGIGAGAHSKITTLDTHTIMRIWKARHPKDYLNPNKPFIAGEKIIPQKELPLEFMMNALRLTKPISISLFQQRTGLSIDEIYPKLQLASEQGLIAFNDHSITKTPIGHNFLNNLLEIF